jgi:peptidoglycan/LPS O-acetylase OafA/YrhL
MTQIGRLSFSIYIWQELPAMYWDTRFWAIALRLGIVAILALVSYYGIERPMIADPNGVEGGGAG